MADQFTVNHDSTVIDSLVHAVKLLFPVWYREFRQLVSDLFFYIHVTDAVCLEQLPLLRSIGRKVSCPAPVCLGRLARHTEISDEVFAFRHFLLIKIQCFAHAFQ